MTDLTQIRDTDSQIRPATRPAAGQHRTLSGAGKKVDQLFIMDNAKGRDQAYRPCLAASFGWMLSY